MASKPTGAGPASVEEEEQVRGNLVSHSIDLRGRFQPGSSRPRPSDERPIIKLSVNLLATFNKINERYYREKREREKKRKVRSSVLTCCLTLHVSPNTDRNKSTTMATVRLLRTVAELLTKSSRSLVKIR